MMEKTVPTIMMITPAIGYKTDGMEEKGIMLYRPYKDKGIIGRIMREIWFRIGMPESVWYNKAIAKQEDISKIVVKDCLITISFLNWIKSVQTGVEIEYFYDNLVGTAKHLLPSQVPTGINLGTFDPGDSQKYGMRLGEGGEFPRQHLRSRLPNEYDVFYVGADKGRGDYVMSLKQQFERMGLKTKFIITPVSIYSKRKDYYSSRIPYSEVLDYDCKSKAILNIVLPGQTGATKRDYEALFLKSKLITNNSNIKNYDFYRPENIFILEEDPIEELVSFINMPLIPIDEKVLQKHLA